VSLQVDELVDHLTLAALAGPEGRGEAVRLSIFAAEVVETRLALAGTRGGSRVNPLQAGDNFVDRPVQAVRVQAIEPGLRPLVCPGPVVVLAQPLGEVQHRRAPPHPGRETLETAQCLLGC
jgi:hypothetical protein